MATTDETIEAEVNRRLALKDYERNMSSAVASLTRARESLYMARNFFRLHKHPRNVAECERLATEVDSLLKRSPQ